MDDVFRCTDRWGREIVLRDDRWYGKILLDRPEFATVSHLIEMALTHPDLVCADKNRDDVEVFYLRDVLLPSPYGRTWLKVCVRFGNGGEGDEGYVLTVFPVKGSHPEERQRWP